MEKGVKSFDIVSEVVELANERFSPIWRIDEEKLDILRSYCVAIDNMITEFSGKSLEVEIDEDDMTVSVVVEVPEIIVSGNGHRFVKLVERTISYGFKATEDKNGIYINFVFPKLWERTV